MLMQTGSRAWPCLALQMESNALKLIMHILEIFNLKEKIKYPWLIHLTIYTPIEGKKLALLMIMPIVRRAPDCYK